MFKIPNSEDNISKKKSSSNIETIIVCNKDVVINKENKNNKNNKNKTVCNNCGKRKRRKKTILLFECRCSYKFCNECLLPENHKCLINYKEMGKIILEKNNPKVGYEKIIPI